MAHICKLGTALRMMFGCELLWSLSYTTLHVIRQFWHVELMQSMFGKKCYAYDSFGLLATLNIQCWMQWRMLYILIWRVQCRGVSSSGQCHVEECDIEAFRQVVGVMSFHRRIFLMSNYYPKHLDDLVIH